MLPPPPFRRGANFGQWLSQVDVSDDSILETRKTADDFHRLADLGADHVRLPIDYELVEDPAPPHELTERGMKYVDRALRWADDAGLAVMLDLHKTPGMSFFTPDENDIWDDPARQERFGNLWRRLAAYYKTVPYDKLAFELLNEPNATDNADWNRIARIGLNAVRDVDKERTVIIGSNSWMVPPTFVDLEDFRDPHVTYAFHFYEPFIFTHQRASWADNMRILDMEMAYPTTVPDLTEAAANMPTDGDREQTMLYSGAALNAARLAGYLQPAIDFAKKAGRPLLCTEFGVIPCAPMDSQVNWYRDVIDLFDRHEIGWSQWFGLFDKQGRPHPFVEVLFPPENRRA